MHLSELLYQDESDWLDFKQEQYRFVGVSDHQKAELLKDILAFANSWRRVDAYILIGVEEVKGDKSLVHGVADHLDDANLQEVVNKKTNRHIEFAYRTEQVEGKSIGVIRLPVQKRPFFIKKDFGGVKAGVVKVRRSSSTDDANPDEIFEMGAAYERTGTPSVSVQFADDETKRTLGTSKSFSCVSLSVPDKGTINDFRRGDVFGIRIGTPTNRDYYRDIVRFYKSTRLLRPTPLCVTNTGDVQIDNLKVHLLFPPTDGLFIQEVEPEEPSEDFMPNIKFRNVLLPEDSVTVKKTADSWRVSFAVGSLQPKADFWTDTIYVGCTQDAELKVPVKAYGKQIADPLTSELTFQFSVTNEQAGSSEIFSDWDKKRR